MIHLKNKIAPIIISSLIIIGVVFIPILGSEESISEQAQPRALITLIDEGFEDEFPPNGWTNNNPSQYSDGWIYDMIFGPAIPHTGDHHIFSWAIGDNITTKTVLFNENTELSFWYRAESSFHNMSLEILVDGIAVWSDPDFNHTEYIQETVDLKNFTGYHKISFLGLTDDFYGQLIDDIFVQTEPDKKAPEINSVTVNPAIQGQNNPVNITSNITDNVFVNEVFVNITYPDTTEASLAMIKNGDIYYLNQSYTQLGEYNFSIWTNDTSGNQNESDENQFEIIEDENCVDLSLGTQFNMITVSVDKPGWNASDLQANITGSSLVARLDAQNQEVEFYTGSPNTDFALKNGEGYLVFMSQESVFSVCGPAISLVSVSLYPGSNIIGWYHEEDTTASSILENITGCSLVGNLNVSTQEFEFYTGSPNTDFLVTQGMGLVIFVDTASVWQGEG